MTWTFLSNHGHVIVQIKKDPDIRLTDLAAQVGVTERRVREIILDLREAGYLEVTKVGRRNSYRVIDAKQLRHSAESTHRLSELLSIFKSF
jgi:DNA-binding transcriptional regulator PaaX